MIVPYKVDFGKTFAVVEDRIPGNSGSTFCPYPLIQCFQCDQMAKLFFTFCHFQQ